MKLVHCSVEKGPLNKLTYSMFLLLVATAGSLPYVFTAVPVFLSSRWLGSFFSKSAGQIAIEFFMYEVEKKVYRIPNMNFLS